MHASVHTQHTIADLSKVQLHYCIIQYMIVHSQQNRASRLGNSESANTWLIRRRDIRQLHLAKGRYDRGEGKMDINGLL